MTVLSKLQSDPEIQFCKCPHTVTSPVCGQKASGEAWFPNSACPHPSGQGGQGPSRVTQQERQNEMSSGQAVPRDRRCPGNVFILSNISLRSDM